MNTQSFEAGNVAYRQGDYAQAVELFSQAKLPGEVSGQIDHLLGNCYMRLGRYDEAATVYGDALRDASYGHAGALACNRGRALLAAGRPQEAIASLSMVAKDSSYTTQYKASLALGDAYLAMDDARDAAVAYRNAAVDEANPVPSTALTKLGDCFMKLGRANDAVESYRTALDFVTPTENQSMIFARMGLAYVGDNRMSEAADAFTRATADGSYQLTPEEQLAAEATRKALASAADNSPSETDALLAAAGYGSANTLGSVDPLDPLGKSGEFIPSPEDTGFFSLDEDEIVQHDKKARRKHRHHGLRIFFIILLLLAILAVGCGFLYYRGFGWPLQEDVAKELFENHASGAAVDTLLADSLSDAEKQQLIQSDLPQNFKEVSSAHVSERSATTTRVVVTVTLEEGGELSYEVALDRDGFGWKVTSVSLVDPSTMGQTPTLGSGV